MKRYRQSETITEGDLVEFDGGLYIASIMNKSLKCTEQCDMAGMKWHSHCTGFCYRWENGDNFVFKSIEVDPKNVTVTQTFRTKLDKEK